MLRRTDVLEPNRTGLRREIGALLVSDSDFDAFCIDYFVGVFRRFSGSMDRTAKENLLLLHADPVRLQECLRSLYQGSGRLCVPLSAPGPECAGTVQPPRAPFDARWYVQRTAEEQRARYSLHYHQPVVLYGPELHGKTWLLQAILQQAPQDGVRVAAINLNLFAKEAYQSIHSFLSMLALRLCKELNLTTEEALFAFNNAERVGGPLHAMSDLLSGYILPQVSGPLILAIDNLDLIAGQPYQEEFFGLLRAWADATDGSLGRLLLVLCISTAPALLAPNVHRSPFNLADVLVLSDLEPPQIMELARIHSLSPSESELHQLWELVGGHPYLTRVAFFGARERAQSLEQVLNEAAKDKPGRRIYAVPGSPAPSFGGEIAPACDPAARRSRGGGCHGSARRSLLGAGWAAGAR